MNCLPKPCARGEHAFALMLVMFFSALSLLYLSGAMNWTTTNANLNERSNQYQSTLLAAETAGEKVVARMFSDFKNQGQGYVNNSLSTYRSLLPTTNESPFWVDYEFNNAQGTINQVHVQTNGGNTVAILSGKYAGLQGTRAPYRIVVNARNKGSRFPITNAVQMEVSFTTIPIFQFAIFYNGLLELSRSASMDIRGRIHSNTNVYYGTSGSAYQKFWEDVSAVGTIEKKQPWFGISSYNEATFVKAKKQNAASLTLPIGTNNTEAAVREVIKMPPSGESPASAMGHERYYNKAEMLILVSNATVTVAVKTPFTTTSNNIPYAQASYFLATNATFYDQRQKKNMQVTDIDVGKFNTWAGTNSAVTNLLGSSTPPNLLYVADNRTRAGYGQVVRMSNGQTLPSRGLTVSSVNALYTKGHFNCPNSSHLGTTNTSATKPASLVGDALTILSSNWNDSKGADSYTTRSAVSTTDNAAILAGNVNTTGTGANNGENSGGSYNLMRLLEAWSGTTLTLNGSMVCLFQSAQANVQFITVSIPESYYSAPTRSINFDQNFNNPEKLPPGTPSVIALERVKWVIPPVNSITYTGY